MPHYEVTLIVEAEDSPRKWAWAEMLDAEAWYVESKLVPEDKICGDHGPFEPTCDYCDKGQCSTPDMEWNGETGCHVECEAAPVPRLSCDFIPQVWLNDYAIAVDPQGDTTWEVSPEYVKSLMAYYGSEFERVYMSSYQSDALKDDPAAPAWIREWSGPFEILTTNLDNVTEEEQ